MTIEEPTPEAAAMLRSPFNNSRPIEDSALLQLLMADRLVMGSPAKVQITANGKRLLAVYEASREYLQSC